MDDILDDDDFDELDESDHSFKRKRPTEASWDSDDELLQEDHIPLKKSRGQSLSDLDEDALLGDSDEEMQGETYDGGEEESRAGGPTDDLSEEREGWEDGQTGGQTVARPADYGDGDESNAGGQKSELSVIYSGRLDDTQGDEWDETRGEGETDVVRGYEEEEYAGDNHGEGGGETYEGGGETYEEGGETYEEGGDNYEESGDYEDGGEETYEGDGDVYKQEYEEEAVLEQATTKDDDDAILEDAILEDAIELEPGMHDFLDIEDLDDSLIEEVAEERTVMGSGARPTTSTPSNPVREKPPRYTGVIEEQTSQLDDRTLSQPKQDDDEEGSDTKEDIPSSDDDDDDDDDSTRARFKSERQPAAVKVGGVSKRKDIPETLEITAEIQQTVDEFARQKEEHNQWRRNRGRGGRGFRGNRGNHNHRQPPLMMGMRHPVNMGPRFPGDMGPRFPGDMVPGFMHMNAPPPPRDNFQPAEVVRGPPAGHFRGGRFDFEPYNPDKEPPSRIPPLITQGSGPEQSGSNQPTPGGQSSVPTTSQAPPAQHTSQSGTPVSSQSQAPKSKTIHINPHFKGQVQVPPQQGGQPPPVLHAPNSAPPPHSQYQPPSTTQSRSYQPPESYPQSSANQYAPQPSQPSTHQFQQHRTPPQGHIQSQSQTHLQSQIPTLMQTHPQGPPTFVEQQQQASYGGPHQQQQQQRQQHFRPQQSEPWNRPASQHQTPGGWSQPGRTDPVSVTWSHQRQELPRQEFHGQPPNQQRPPRFSGPQSPHERFRPSHQHNQGTRQQQPSSIPSNRMRPSGEPQHVRGPPPNQQRPGYRQQVPSTASRQGGPRQRFQNPNQRQQPRQPSPRQPSPQQPSPQQLQAKSSQPSPQNPIHKGRILPSPKRLIEEASKKASKAVTVNTAEGEIDEDAETKRLRIQLGEQKKLREMILQRKEARRQQLAAAKQAELKKRIASQKQDGAGAKEASRPQQQPQQQQRQPPANQGVRMPGPRHPSPQQQGGQGGGNRSVSAASANRTLPQQNPRPTPRMQGMAQQWAGGPRQQRPTQQPRPQGAVHGEMHGMRHPGPQGQQFQQQTWQQQQNVKVLVDVAPQPIPTLGGGGNIIQPQQPIGVVGSVGRTSPGQARGQRPQGLQGNVPRGRGRGRGQPNRAQFQQQQQQQQQQHGFQSPQQPQPQPQSAGPRPQGVGPRPQSARMRGRGRGRAGPQAMGPRMQSPGPRMQSPGPMSQGIRPQGPGATAGLPQGQVRPQRRSVKDRIGIPQQGNAQPRPVAPQPRPVASQPRSVAPQPRPVAPQPRPVTSQPRPVAPQPRPVAPQPRPVAPQPRPVTSQPRPVAPQPQRRVIQQNQAQTTPPNRTLQTGTNPAGGRQQQQQQQLAAKKRTVLQHMTPQQRLLQQQQQQRAAQVAQVRPGAASQPVRVLPPQPERVVKQASTAGAQVVGGPTGILIDGLSASTSRGNLVKMLQTCGPIKNVEIIPSQRRAVAKFCRPEDAQTFQTKFHRHMIDLANINVSLVPD